MSPLVEVNLALIDAIRDILDIRTPLLTTAPPLHAGVDRLIEQVLAVGGDAYLSGTGGRAYMGPDAEQRFADAGVRLEWSAHHHLTGDSIVTVLMDFDDPMAAITHE